MTDTTEAAAATDPRRRLSEIEFIALVAMLTATVAFSIDAMLPALPQIGAELSPAVPNRAQLILSAFIAGMGLGTLVTGPMSDRFGRKPVILGGALLYIAGALLAWMAPTLETMLAARLIQGLGAAAPRVAAMAMVRDLYSGRQMARTLSFVMMIFALVPAIAPTLGYGIIATVGWRGIFPAFVVFALLGAAWLALRQPETLPQASRRRYSPADIAAALREMWAHPTARLATIVQTIVLGMLFATLQTTQLAFDQTYGRGDSFHLWFGLIAVLAASSSFVNARYVVRLGMRAMIKGMFTAQIAFSATMIAVLALPLPQAVEFPLYVIWTVSLFFQAGLCIGNLNALALEPMGHVAGLAATVVSSVGTLGAVAIAVPVGLAFDGTPLPHALASLALAALALWLTTKIRRDTDPD